MFKYIKKKFFDTVNYDCEKYLKMYQKYQLTNNQILKIYYKKKKIKYEKVYNCFIPFSAKLDDNINFPHGLNGIFISSNAVIGKNTTIFQQVTIGSNTLEDSKKFGAPTIGENVYIGAGAKIIGNVKIGNNVRIGANCVVTKDVVDNATIVLNNPRVIIHNETRKNEFVNINKIII